MIILMALLPLAAAELSYKWKKGDTHTFHFESRTTVKMEMGGAMPGMDMMGGMMGGMAGGTDSTFEVACDFKEKVLAVDSHGTANMDLQIEKLTIGGADVTSKLPAAAKIVKAEVDRKGHAKFFKMVTVYVEEDGQLTIAMRSAKKGLIGASTTATVDGEEVTVFAEIDPKTGQARGGAVHKRVAKKTQKRAESEKREDTTVDALPKEIFEMMALPEGAFEPGSETSGKNPLGTMRISAGELEGNVVPLHFVLETNVKTGPGQAPADVESDPEYQAAAAPSRAGMQSTFDGAMRFDLGAGSLQTMSGNHAETMDAAGVKMKTSGTFSLTRRGG